MPLDPAPPAPPKRTRESTSKVRTGCTTCKARRVKCDETKPTCRRCAIGSRACEYITTQPAPPVRRNVITVYVAPAQSQPVVFANNRGCDFFHRNLAAELGGQFDSTFWRRLVLQLSQSEPAVRHAVSAISVLHHDNELALRDPAGYVKANPDAHREWNLAIKSLSARIQAQPNSNLVPLTCCLLFTCIEFLKGNVEASLVHVSNGINILAALRRNSNVDGSPGSNISSTDLEAIEAHIVPMFSGLNVLCSLAGKITPPIYTPPTQEDSAQNDLADSRRRLFAASDACIRLIGYCLAVRPNITVDNLAEQAKLNTRLSKWRDQLDKLVKRTKDAGIVVKEDAVNLLLVHYKVIYILLQVCTTPGEMATDKYDADFEELVSCAEQIVKRISTPQPLSFEVQILGPLFYAAMKCRNPKVRRRALAVLKLAPRREGLWNGYHAYVTAKRVIELEESLLNEQGLPDESVRVFWLPLPEDKSRTYDLDGLPADLRKARHTIVPSPTCPGIIEAVFQYEALGACG